MAFRQTWSGLEGLAKDVERQLAADATTDVRATAEFTKALARAETRAGFQGNRLDKAWRSQVYPRGQNSMDAAGFVYVRRDPRGDVARKIIGLAATGGVIRSKQGFWIPIPTREAGRFGIKASAAGAYGVTTNSRNARERISPGGFERRTGMKLRFVYGDAKRSFLVVDEAQLTRGIASPYRSKGRGSRLYGPRGRTIVVFTLVPFVRGKKRLDLDHIARRGADFLVSQATRRG
jgi:hypothetical protein